MDILVGRDSHAELSLCDSMSGSDSLNVDFYGRGSGRGRGRPYVVCELYGFRLVVADGEGHADLYSAMWMGGDELKKATLYWLGQTIAKKPEILEQWHEALLARQTP